MATTYTLISSNVLSSSAASVTFSSIPSTYTDLVVRMSTRMSAGTNQQFSLYFNGDTSLKYSQTYILGDGSTAASGSSPGSSSLSGFLVSEGTTQTANTFSNNEVYIPSYTASQNKPVSGFGASETNATAAWIQASAGIYLSNTAISSMTFIDDINGRSFVTGSSFYLYGIKNL